MIEGPESGKSIVAQGRYYKYKILLLLSLHFFVRMSIVTFSSFFLANLEKKNNGHIEVND